MGLASEQSLDNLAVRAVEPKLIPALRRLRIGLIPYSPLHAGLLAGALETATKGRNPDESMQHRIEAHRDQLEADEGLCRQLGAKPVEVVLAWLLRNPAVSTASYGPTSARCRCSWTPRLWNDSTESNQVCRAGRPIRRFRSGAGSAGSCVAVEFAA